MAINRSNEAIAVEPGTSEPSGEQSDSDTIGRNTPLQIRIHRLFTGRVDHGQALVTSAVKSLSNYDAGPRALHYLFNSVQQYQFLTATAEEPGSPIVYYSPANLDGTLKVTIRIAFDRFDKDRWEKWVDVIAQSASLPVFALGFATGGLAGVGGGKALLVAAKSAAKIILGAIDREVDDDNDFISTYELNIDTPGVASARSGWLLFRDDRENAFIRDPSEDEQLQDWIGDDPNKAEVDPEGLTVDQRGNLVYRDTNKVVDDLGNTYALVHVSTQADDQLKMFKPAAVSAVLADKFLSVSSDGLAGDLAGLLSIYNDVTLIKAVSAVDKRIESESDDNARAELDKERKSLLKNFQDSDLADLVAK